MENTDPNITKFIVACRSVGGTPKFVTTDRGRDVICDLPDENAEDKFREEMKK